MLKTHFSHVAFGKIYVAFGKIYVGAVLCSSCFKLITVAQQREAVTQGRSRLSPLNKQLKKPF
ncbi:MAG: hypothetical protein LBJ00_06070 [Planctomycetaceae bacterium]|nr:hypothetical protein [Planctomycetaceae bacterium]